MKKIMYTLPIVLLACIFLSIQSCTGDEPTPAEKTTKLLVGNKTSKTWKMQSVTVNGTDKTSLFTGFTIKFTETGYTTTNGGLVWPSGSWSFTDPKATSFKRGDGIVVTVSATASTLTLTMPWNKTTFGSGRANSISGSHVFVFGL